MTHFIYKLKKFINKPIFIFWVKIGIVLLLVAFFTSLIFYLKKNNPPNIKLSKSSNYTYVAKNGIYTASFGEKDTNVAKVNFAIGGSEITFTPASGEEKEHKIVKNKESIKFEEIYKGIDFIYHTKPNGIKEDIILKNPVEYKVLPFYLDFKGIEPQYLTNNIKGKVFYDMDKNYLFHIEKPYAIDAANVRSDNFDYQIRKDSQTGKYVALLSFDSEWINDKSRKFPITIDPTIVHDTTVEFSTGQFNRIKDTGAAPAALATGGTITYSGGYTIHTFTGDGTFTPSTSLSVEYLLVAGGGGGAANNSTCGGGGGGAGGFKTATGMSVTATGYPVVVGTAGAGGVASNNGTSGGDSTFNSITATGGGRGSITTQDGIAGGSGGGAGSNCGGANKTGGAASPAGQGNAGGNTQGTYSGGGGGGASAAGVLNGGNGTSSSITGTATTYGGGGGAGSYTGGGGSAGSGGTGGGGAGSGSVAGTAGTANTGGGGGGGGYNGSYNNGGNGGTGIVIIRYLNSQVSNLETYYQELPVDINTIGLWHMNETADNTCSGGQDACDVSGNSNHGTFNGNAAFTTTAKLGANATTYDGTGDYTTIATQIALADTKDYTLELWYKGTDTAANGGCADCGKVLLGRNNGDIYANFILDSGYAEFLHYNGAYFHNIKSTTMVADGNWHHIAYVNRTNETGDLYIDGKAEIIGLSSSISNDAFPFRIDGFMNGYNSVQTSGIIDEVKISGVARSAEEIKSSASRRPYGVFTSDVIDLTAVSSWNPLTWTELGVNTGDGETLKDSTSLVAQWNFNETSGTTADNAETTSALDGTLTGFASTASQDQAAGTGWTSSNRRWGAGALMFDGSNDVVTAAKITNLEGANNYSIESWIKTGSSAHGAVFTQSDTGNHIIALDTNYSANKVSFVTYEGGYSAVNSNININDGSWHHVVLTKSGTTGSIYVDGKLDNSGTVANVTSTTGIRIGTRETGVYPFNGTIDSTRVYSRVITSSEIMSNYQAGNIEIQTRVGTDATPDDGSWEAWKPTTGETAIDGYDSNPAPNYYTTTLLHGDNVDTSTIFTDNALYPKTYTASGNAQIDTAQSKFGGSSMLFDGTGDYISATDSNDWSMNTGNFTIDAWVRINSLASAIEIFSNNTDANNITRLEISPTGYIIFDVYSGGVQIVTMQSSAGAFTTNTWYHVAVVRNGNVWDIYKDGTSVANVTDADTWANYTGSFYVGSNAGTVSSFNGWIDEFRVVKGAALWTSTFTPSTTAYDNLTQIESATDTNIKIENTGSNRLTTGRPKLDGSSVGLWNFDETSGNANNSTSVSGLTLTATNTPGSANGFSGKSRSLTAASSQYFTCTDANCGGTSKLDPNSANGWSMGGWVYANSFPGTAPTLMLKTGGGTGPFLMVNTSGQLRGEMGNVTCNNDTSYGFQSAATIPLKKWTYVMMTVSAANPGVLKLYMDGSLKYTSATSAYYCDQTGGFYIGSNAGAAGYYWDGNLDEMFVSASTLSDEQVAENYRAGRDHYLNKTISSTDLSSKSSLPFYVAADRPGSYLSATIGESPYANYQPDSSTVGLWHLDEQSGTTNTYIKDSSGNGNNSSTITGTTYTQGQIGKARNFNGTTDVITIPDSDNWSFGSGDFTVDYWIKPTAIDSQRGIFAQELVAGYPAHFAEIYLSKIRWVLRKASGGNGDIVDFSSTTSVVTGVWHHITLVKSGNNYYIYVNGKLDASTSSATATENIADQLDIGYRSGDPNQFSGTIDEFRISKAIARSASEIRQAFEVGQRTHPITIDFGAKLDSGNLITGSGDLGFTVDATYYGLQNKGDQLFKGDKVIVRENDSGTEYIAQGTVDAITISTGAATVSAWDSGSTFPSGGFTVNASVFKWQREYWNINNEVLDTSINAVTNLTLRLTDGNEGRTIWLDDLRSNSDYLTTPTGSTITSSAGNRYLQYRAVLSSFDEAVSATMSGITIDYVTNAAPATPSLDLPTNTATNQILSPILKTTTTDADSDYLRYKIQICTDLAMTTSCQTFDQTSSQTGWSGQNTQSSTAYTSGTQGVYTVQTPLSAGTTYYWRSYAIDPGGSNTFSATQTPYSFTTSFLPATPSLDYPTNGSTGQPITSVFKTTTTDADSDYLRYKIQVCTNLIMTTGCQTFDETSSQTGWSGQNTQSSTAYTSGTQATYTVVSNLAFNTTYYWRSYAIDPAGTNTFSGTQTPYSFTTVANTLPQSPTLLLVEGEGNPIMVTDLTPEFSAICNEADVIDTLVKYRIQVDTTTAFASPVWDSGASGTAMTACNPGARSVDISYAGSALSLNGATYHWRIKFWDNNGAEGAWSGENPFFKMDNPNDGRPSNCRVTETPSDTSLTLKWTDNSTSETQFRIERNVNSGGFTFLTNVAANSVSNIDSTVSVSNTYQYRVRSEGAQNSNWCETTVFSLLQGNFLLKGLNLKGLNFK